MKLLNLPILLVILHLYPVFPGPTGIVTRAVKPSQASAARLHEIVTRLQEYIGTITEELKSFERQLKKESSKQDAGDPHGMVVTDEKTERPDKTETSTEGTEEEAEDEEEEEEEEDECHCDCDALGLGGTGTRKRRAGGSKVNSKHVAEILKTIRELLHEADGRR